MFPRRCSSCRYSSIVIVGNLCELRNTSECSRSRSDRAVVDGRIVNGRRTRPPPEMSSLGLTAEPGVRSRRHCASSFSSRFARGSSSGPCMASFGALARRDSSIAVFDKLVSEREYSSLRMLRVTSRRLSSSSLTLVDEDDSWGRRASMKAMTGDEASNWPGSDDYSQFELTLITHSNSLPNLFITLISCNLCIAPLPRIRGYASSSTLVDDLVRLEQSLKLV